MTPMPLVASTASSLRLSDLRGLTQLGFDATLGVTDLVEQMHRTIVKRAGIVGRIEPGRTRGITGVVYGSIRGITGALAKGVGATLGALDRGHGEGPILPQREAAIAALNGVWGDHLAETGNPLAIEMSLRVAGRRVDLAPGRIAQALPNATGRVLVQVHGLCMNDLQWTRNGHDHGQALAQQLGYTPVALHYNSGEHIASNGRRFAELLDELLAHWPVAVQEIVLLGHSMGGLVARSACHHARQAGLGWLRHLTRLACLGAPHHGAVLERGGHLVDTLFELSPYVAPFARLGKARSAGITDLRYGNVQDADGQGRARHDQRHDDRRPTPLPQGVQTFLVAATRAEQPRGLRHALIGDGLVTVASALGEHRDPTLALNVPASQRMVVTSANHWDLLDRPAVAQRLLRWLA